MTRTNLKQGIALIFAANVINSVFSLLVNFLLPKYLTIDAYAQIKTFLMYSSYVGILHLGYSDGIYLRYGGKSLSSKNLSEVMTDIQTMRVFQLVVSSAALVLSLVLHDWILVASVLTIMPINMANFYRYLLQATGEFESYSKSMNVTTILTSCFILLLLLFKLYTQWFLYVSLYIIAYYIIWGYFEYLIKNKYHIFNSNTKKTFSVGRLVSNVQSGFFLMLGTFSDIILTGMDRWFVKATMDNAAFAMYSFSVSVIGMLNIVVSPIATTLFNYFCINKSENSIKKADGLITLFATGIVAVAFPARFIVEMFLKNYEDSNQLLTYLFASQMFYIVLKCYHINLYKAQKRQKIYFSKLVLVIICGFFFNTVLYYALKTKEAFAIGTLLCGIVWYAMARQDVDVNLKNGHCALQLTLMVLIFVFLGLRCNSIAGLVIYTLCWLAVSFTLLKKEIIWLNCQLVKLIRGQKWRQQDGDAN